MKYLLIYGKNSDLSAAEAGSLFEVKESAENLAIIESTLAPEEIIDTLGGSTKICGDILILDNKSEVIAKLTDIASNFSTQGKINFGISDYAGIFKDQKEIEKTLTKLKQKMKRARFVLNFPILSSVQVEKNDLINKGFELIIGKIGNKFVIARTLAVQDFEGYSRRDYSRPCRPMETGMLPPKLAKMLINMTVREIVNDPVSAPLVIDPFCGAGTIIQEAILENFKAYGSDIDDKMVVCARKNLEYLVSTYNITRIRNPKELISLEDARVLPHKADSIDFMVTEGYLGPRWTKKPPVQELEQEFAKIKNLALTSLTEAMRLLKPGGRVGFILPEVDGDSPKILDEVLKLGYTALVKDLGYKRPDQIVGRRLFVLQK